MALLNFTPNQNRSSNQTNAADRPDSKLWMNVGYEVDGKFVSLPFGIAVDTMRDANVVGQNEEFVKLRNAQNALLAHLKKEGAKFAPGQAVKLNLQVELRRVNEVLDIAKGDNELITDLSQIFAAPAIPQAAE